MSRTKLSHCAWCGVSIMGGHSILEVNAGELAKWRDEPWIELCGPI
jgi:hypothetical protein